MVTCAVLCRGGASVTDIAALGVSENTLRTLGFSYEEISESKDNTATWESNDT